MEYGQTSWAFSISFLASSTLKPATVTLAEHCGMSLSGFHAHFKKLTTLSPLQYQKTLRLLEAKRLISQENLPISTAVLQVGYESPSQFSREYKRYFGVSPKGSLGRDKNPIQAI